MVTWFHDLLYATGDPPTGWDAKKSETEHYAFLEAHAPAGPTGLCITPNLIGTCNPDFNPHARGIVYGLTAGTGRSQMYKGILEGLACELSKIVQLLAKAAGDFDDMCVTGGGTRSVLGLALRAALTGKRLHVMRCPEAVCLGGAILAGVATGEYGSISEAVGRVVREVAVVRPDPEIASAYAKQLRQYQWLSSSLAQLPDT